MEIKLEPTSPYMQLPVSPEPNYSQMEMETVTPLCNFKVYTLL